MSTFHSKTPDLDTVAPAQFNWIITLTLAMCCTSSMLRSSQAKFMTSVCVCVCVCVQARVICCAVHKMSGLCFQVEAKHVNIADIAF